MNYIAKATMTGLVMYLGLGVAIGPAEANDGDPAALRQLVLSKLDKTGISGPAAIVTLNGQVYSPGAVLCTQGDRISRIAFAGMLADLPIVKIAVFDSETENELRIEFQGSDRHQLWQLQEGDLIQEGNRFEAYGYLHGAELEMNSDGTIASSTPLPGADRVPFAATVRCE